MLKPIILFSGIIGLVLTGLSCMDRKPAPVCPVPIELNRTKRQVNVFEGVDMLVVVDDSGSMAEEQAILSTQFFTLINSLVFPTADWDFPAARSVRIGIVSSDMGLRYGSEINSDYATDGSLKPCYKRGENGKFRTYSSGKKIDIRQGEIKCNLTGDPIQCPTGWECRDSGQCEGKEDHPDVGCCYDPGGNGTDQTCPTLNGIYAQTPLGLGDNQTPNEDLAFQASCLADVGIDGCGLEQQLQAAAQGLVHPDNSPDEDSTFYRENYLLAVIVVSDEEDCSAASSELFESTELTGDHTPHKKNIACGMNRQHLFPPRHFKKWFNELKGDESSTIFAAIVGVPPNEEGAVKCEGRGTQIKDCLNHEDMEAVPVIELNSSGNEHWVFREACRREDNSGTLVTQARPGARYVELAKEYGSLSYVSSICNEDWSPAMSEIGSLIASRLQGTCYPKPLDWDNEEERAKCHVVVEYVDEDECGFELDDGDEPYETVEEIGDQSHTVLYCPLPRLSAPLDCTAAEEVIDNLDADRIGWYYCEDNRENFEQACDPDGKWAGLDEDEDGLVDCQDPQCWRCNACKGEDGVDPSNAPECVSSCKFKVELTQKAKHVTKNHKISVQCLQQVTFTDTNCQENTEEVCNDGEDNDGSGVADCMASDDYLADRNCCPMMVDEDTQECIVSSEVEDICDEGAASDACVMAAKALRCNLKTTAR